MLNTPKKACLCNASILTLVFSGLFLICSNAYAADTSTGSYTFAWLSHNPFAYLFLALAMGYPLGRLSLCGISLGATAGTLIVGIAISFTAKTLYGMTFHIPGLVEDIALMMFMYALGMKVGPQFFSGFKRGGWDFFVIGLITVFSNFLIVFLGAKLVGLAPGYAAGIISGSYTVTAVMGVAQSAISSGAYKMPDGLTADVVGANMAAGYAISYVLSSVFIILLIKYLPTMFGHDPVKSAKDAEASFGSDKEALPGTSGSSKLGLSDLQIRSYRVDHSELTNQPLSVIHQNNPNASVVKILRGEQLIEANDDSVLKIGDIIGIMGEYSDLLKESEVTGNEVDEPRVRSVAIEVADIHIGAKSVHGKTLLELEEEIGFGVSVKALFRSGVPEHHLPDTVVETGDVIRLIGPEACINRVAKTLEGKPVVESSYTEVSFMSIALTIGYLIGHFSLTIKNIPFALGTSAGCMLMGIFVSWLRTRNPNFGGPTSEGARSFMNDIGLSFFVAVLASSVGPKILNSFQGSVIIWIALLGLAGALIPPFISWLYGYYIRKMNPVILAGTCAGSRNSTPGLNGIQDISKSAIAAIGYPVPYALTSALVLILGYIAMVFS